MSSPTSLRRASSETKLAMLHEKGVTRNLEKKEKKALETSKSPQLGSQVWEEAEASTKAETGHTAAASSEKCYLNVNP